MSLQRIDSHLSQPGPRLRHARPALTAAFAGVLLFLSVAPGVFAQNNATVSGEWSDSAIWSQGIPPQLGDGVNPSNIEATATVTLTGGQLAGVTDGTLDVGRGGTNGATAILRVQGGTLTVSGNIASGNNDFGANGTRTGILDIQGGSVSFNNRNVFFGVGGGNTGTFLMSGGTFLATNQVRFGNNGTGLGTFTGGFFNINDDGDTADDMLLSQNASSRSNVTVTGDTNFRTGDDITIAVRGGSVGSMTISGNATVSADQLFVGSGPGATTNEAAAPGRGIGVLTVSGGSTNLRNGGASMIIGNQDDTMGTLNVTGGHLTTNGDIVMANIGVIAFHTTATQTRFATVFGASQGFFNQTGGTVDIGNGTGGGDDFFIGQRGKGTVNLSGGQLNVDRDFILGRLADSIGSDTGGAGNGIGVATITGTSDVNVGRDLVLGAFAGENGNTIGTLNVAGDATIDVARNLVIGQAAGAEGVVNIAGTASPVVTVEGLINIGTIPGSSGRLNISGSNTVHAKTNVLIGSANNANALLTQTGGALLVDGELITRFIEDASGTATGYDFRGGTLSRSDDGVLTITGDLVVTDLATLSITGGDFNEDDDGVDPFSGFPGGPTITGITLNVTEGFRSIDADGMKGNFMGGGVIDLNNISIIPTANGLTTQAGIFWFAIIDAANGDDGGDDLTDLASTFLDDIDLVNLANIDGSFTRLSESDFESMTFDGSEENQSFYALINGDGITGFFPRSGQNLGIAWFVRIPEPGSALLVLLGGTLFLGRRRRR